MYLKQRHRTRDLRIPTGYMYLQAYSINGRGAFYEHVN